MFETHRDQLDDCTGGELTLDERRADCNLTGNRLGMERLPDLRRLIFEHDPDEVVCHLNLRFFIEDCSVLLP
jgi:hypothetical protein